MKILWFFLFLFSHNKSWQRGFKFGFFMKLIPLWHKDLVNLYDFFKDLFLKKTTNLEYGIYAQI